MSVEWNNFVLYIYFKFLSQLANIYLIFLKIKKKSSLTFLDLTFNVKGKIPYSMECDDEKSSHIYHTFVWLYDILSHFMTDYRRLKSVIQMWQKFITEFSKRICHLIIAMFFFATLIFVSIKLKIVKLSWDYPDYRKN
jgi:hypothetical protein